MEDLQAVRAHAAALLQGGGAHRGIKDVFRNVPSDLRGTRPESLAHSLWELLEHIRIAQWDILEFSRDPEHVSPEFPSGYWPNEKAPPSREAWQESLSRLEEDLEAMVGLVRDGDRPLLEPVPWGDGQTLLREALLVADHHAYHLGQAVDARRALGIWPPGSP